MLDLPLMYQNFVSASVCQAEYTTIHGTQTLVIETRTYMKRINESQTQRLFTMIDEEAVQVPSLIDLVLRDAECSSLSIPHSVVIELNGVTQRAMLTEIYTPHHGDNMNWSIKLLLAFDKQIFETEQNDCLQDAFVELGELVGSRDALWVKICYQCNYVHVKRSGIQDEREDLQCFRDSPPQLFEEAKRRLKFASAEAWASGDFFVNAFHTCAAWQRWQPPAIP